MLLLDMLKQFLNYAKYGNLLFEQEAKIIKTRIIMYMVQRVQIHESDIQNRVLVSEPHFGPECLIQYKYLKEI